MTSIERALIYECLGGTPHDWHGTVFYEECDLLIEQAISRVKGCWQATPVGLLAFRIRNCRRPVFRCPICGYRGPFKTLSVPTGDRSHALCPKCHAYERHRLQYLVMQKLRARYSFETLHMLHFAPERALHGIFRNMFGAYTTADLSMLGVDHQVDITNLPFEDRSFDVIYASHVLEHIPDDRKAIAEIRRILRPGGFAVLPVPVLGPVTVEYDKPNPQESDHVRAPGRDYFERYRSVFDDVEEFRSTDFCDDYQLFSIREGESNSGNGAGALESPAGRITDVVPVCLVANV